MHTSRKSTQRLPPSERPKIGITTRDKRADGFMWACMKGRQKGAFGATLVV